MKMIKMRLIAATVLGSSLGFSPFIVASTPDTADLHGHMASNDAPVIMISKAGENIDNAEHHKMAERHEMAERPDIERPEIEYPERVEHFDRAERPASSEQSH